VGIGVVRDSRTPETTCFCHKGRAGPKTWGGGGGSAGVWGVYKKWGWVAQTPEKGGGQKGKGKATVAVWLRGQRVGYATGGGIHKGEEATLKTRRTSKERTTEKKTCKKNRKVYWWRNLSKRRLGGGWVGQGTRWFWVQESLWWLKKWERGTNWGHLA